MEQNNGNSKENEANVSVESAFNKEKVSVGSVLRKQRVSLGLSVEKISNDLRISKNYVKAIEDGDYDTIPAEPYIRAYVKTIADFLSLDSEKLIEQLTEERGASTEVLPKDEREDRKTELKIPLNVSENKKNTSFIIVALFVLLLFVLLYFGANKNGLSQSSDYQESSEDNSSAAVLNGADDSLANLFPDSLVRGDTILNEKDAAVPVDMQIRVLRDSSWIEIVTDGKLFQLGKIIRGPSKVIEASAFDSINIYVGASAVVEINVNGKTVDKAGATGVWKFTKDSVKVLSPSVWGRVKRVPL